MDELIVGISGVKGGRFASFMPKGSAFERAQIALKLQLTSEQHSEVKDIYMTASELKQSIVDQLVLNREQIKTFVKIRPYDERRVQAIATEQGELISQLIMIKVKTKFAVLAVLTKEQKKRLGQEKALDMNDE